MQVRLLSSAYGSVMELVDLLGLEPSALRRVGSSPTGATKPVWWNGIHARLKSGWPIRL